MKLASVCTFKKIVRREVKKKRKKRETLSLKEVVGKGESLAFWFWFCLVFPSGCPSASIKVWILAALRETPSGIHFWLYLSLALIREVMFIPESENWGVSGLQSTMGVIWPNPKQTLKPLTLALGLCYIRAVGACEHSGWISILLTIQCQAAPTCEVTPGELSLSQHQATAQTL